MKFNAKIILVVIGLFLLVGACTTSTASYHAKSCKERGASHTYSNQDILDYIHDCK